MIQRLCRMRGHVAALSLFICILIVPFSAHAELVDHIVAAVNYEVITASELAYTLALNARLGADNRDRKTIETETFEGLITRRLLVQEARRLRFVEITDQEIGAEDDKLRKRFGSDRIVEDFLKEQNMSARELSRVLGERLLVERFVEKKVGLFVRVSRDEAQSYFDAHASEYTGKRFQDEQKTISTLLMERKVGQQLEQYVAELRSKADIRINAH
jgi:hypothetical protein